MLSCLVKENTDVMISWTSHVDKYYLDHVELYSFFLVTVFLTKMGWQDGLIGAVADSVRNG